ncbi:hypothetical protein GCM10007291_02020 [Gemmobacter nanjingensis]|uniref:Pyocin activator protein PrtN n=1 Tax=Gemmobacter nanjingensis TaxID=488454 RepID=A0ABQ3F6J2_9RHOB|nr:pyocin activator PrtN family protein [Gemmobacter nanjingensis]GHC09470.1 hypothetical protein GCM10007291_02020 [Gemmobacter nanjingensis]
MDTTLMLMARYEGRPILPVEVICKDFFPHLTREKFLRKVADGAIKLPLVQIEGSQKSAKGVDLRDLAAYYDERREAARKEFHQLHG